MAAKWTQNTFICDSLFKEPFTIVILWVALLGFRCNPVLPHGRGVRNTAKFAVFRAAGAGNTMVPAAFRNRFRRYRGGEYAIGGGTEIALSANLSGAAGNYGV